MATPSSKSSPMVAAGGNPKVRKSTTTPPHPRRKLRRSDRIPRQPRKSGPAPPVHVDLSDEDEQETSKVAPQEASSSDAPEPSSPKSKSTATTPAKSNLTAGELSSKQRKAQIREGKRPTTAPAKSSPKAASSKNSKKGGTSSEDNAGFEMSKAFSLRFYTEAAAQRWETIREIPCVGERNIDEVSFAEFNLVDFLKSRRLLSSLVNFMPYPKEAIHLIYSGLTLSFGDRKSKKYGKVYYKGRVYTLSPRRLNEALGTPNSEEEVDEDCDLNKVATEITGGRKRIWKQPMSASSLTYLYSVVYKLMTTNWIVTTNNTIVTQQHGRLLYTIGQNKAFNLGRIVFQQIADTATHTQLSLLPFPSLIYKVLRLQHLREIYKEPQLTQVTTYAINKQLFGSGKVRDLPWINPTTSTNETGSSNKSNTVTIPRVLLNVLLTKIADLEQRVLREHTAHMDSLNEVKLQLAELMQTEE